MSPPASERLPPEALVANGGTQEREAFQGNVEVTEVWAAGASDRIRRGIMGMPLQLRIPWLALIVVAVVSVSFNLQAVSHPTKAANAIFLGVVSVMVLISFMGLVLERTGQRTYMPGWLYISLSALFGVVFTVRALIEGNMMMTIFTVSASILLIGLYWALYVWLPTQKPNNAR
jgi:cbb3-type cytochrome oxidase subunit 1